MTALHPRPEKFFARSNLSTRLSLGGLSAKADKLGGWEEMIVVSFHASAAVVDGRHPGTQDCPLTLPLGRVEI